MVPFTFEMQWKIFKSIEYSTPIFVSQITLMQPWPEQLNRLKVMVKPFDILVRITYAFSQSKSYKWHEKDRITFACIF